MPIFEVTIERKVTKYDTFTRYIDADTREEAEEAAERLAQDAEENGTPDDATEGDANDLGDWEVGDITEPDEEVDPSDIIPAAEAGR